MRFKTSLNLLLNNFGTVYKLVLYRVVVALITLLVCSAIIVGGLEPTLRGDEMNAVIALVKEFFVALSSGNTQFLSTFSGSFESALASLLAALFARAVPLTFTAIGFVLAVFLSKYFFGLGNMAAADLLNMKMSANAQMPLRSSILLNLKTFSIFQLIYIPVSTLIDIIVIVLCYLFFFASLTLFDAVAVIAIFISVFLTVTAVILGQAVKHTIFCEWLPMVIADKKKVPESFIQVLKESRRDFNAIFANYLVMLYVIVMLNAIGLITTFGSAMMVTVPLSQMLLISYQFANYYTINKKDFFMSKDTIVKNKTESKKIGIFKEEELL